MLKEIDLADAQPAEIEAGPVADRPRSLMNDEQYRVLVARRDELSAQATATRARLDQCKAALRGDGVAAALADGLLDVDAQVSELETLDAESTRLERRLKILERAEAEAARAVKAEAGPASSRIRDLNRAEYLRLVCEMNAAFMTLELVHRDYAVFLDELEAGGVGIGEFQQARIPFDFSPDGVPARWRADLKATGVVF